MKVYEKLNKMFNTNDSLRKTVIDMFMENLKNHIQISKDFLDLEEDDLKYFPNYSTFIEYDNLDYERIFNKIEEYLLKDETEIEFQVCMEDLLT